MPGATVSIKNAGTNQVREAVTGADGSFSSPICWPAPTTSPSLSRASRPTSRKASCSAPPNASRCGTIALEVGQLQETVTVTSEASLVQTNNAARSGLVDRTQIDDIAVKGRDFASYLKLLPGVVDTSAREAPGWGSMGGLSINGRTGGFNFSYDGVTNKDTGSNSGNYAAPGARLDRGSARPDLEFPGRVRPQLRRDRHGHHPQRLEGLPRQRRLLQARRCLERQRVFPAAALRTGCHDPVQTAGLRFRQRRLDAGRAGAAAGHVLQPGPQQAVLLLVAGHPRPHRSRRPAGAPDADTARAQRRLLAVDGQPGPAAVHPRPAARRQLQRHDRRPGVFPGQRDSGRSHQRDGAARCSTCSRCPTPR